MAPTNITDQLISWADDLDPKTIHQAAETAKLPIVAGHVALMPDAHLGYGCAIGSVVPTDGAIIPSAVGVDIGCGMAAVRTDLDAADLPDDLGALRDLIERRVPAGIGQGHDRRARRVGAWLEVNRARTDFDQKQKATAANQLGSLGSGNHFIEVSLDEADRVWVVLHSGSRGIGNQLAQGHIKLAKHVAGHAGAVFDDPDLAYFIEGTPEFDHYVANLRWAQAYAWENREIMLDEVVDALLGVVGHGRAVERVSCHHNYAEVEHHGGRDVWVTRKGAIRAQRGDLGIIPGSMGTDTFIVEGLANPLSFNSCSHGAGRRMSRNQARKTLTPESLAGAMGDRTWLAAKADKLVDEHPDAYKDIDHVMALQADLVQVRDRLRSVLNYKGA
jgi:tRNA-splicing ligase RtcB